MAPMSPLTGQLSFYLHVYSLWYLHINACSLAKLKAVRIHTNRVSFGDVLVQILDGPLGRVTLSVISPHPRGGGRLGRRAVRGTTTQRLAALGVRTLQVVRVVVVVGQVEHLQRGVLGRRTDARRDSGRLGQVLRLGYRREGDVPVVPRDVRDGARVPDDDAAQLLRLERQSLQDVQNFILGTITTEKKHQSAQIHSALGPWTKNTEKVDFLCPTILSQIWTLFQFPPFSCAVHF